MAELIDVRTRKLVDGRVEAIAITDKEDAAGDPLVITAYGATPEEATAAARAQASELPS